MSSKSFHACSNLYKYLPRLCVMSRVLSSIFCYFRGRKIEIERYQCSVYLVNGPMFEMDVGSYAVAGGGGGKRF